jgi:hypothetical protein
MPVMLPRIIAAIQYILLNFCVKDCGFLIQYILLNFRVKDCGFLWKNVTLPHLTVLHENFDAG